MTLSRSLVGVAVALAAMAASAQQTNTKPRILLVGVNVQYYADLLYEAGAKPAAKT